MSIKSLNRTLDIIVIVSIFISGLCIGIAYEMGQSIPLKLLEQRVFDEYGAGDAGVEQMLFLKTGVHQDFMGNPYPEDTIIQPRENLGYNVHKMEGVEYIALYQVTISDTMTYIYNQYGKYVGQMPFDGKSMWDSIMIDDNQ